MSRVSVIFHGHRVSPQKVSLLDWSFKRSFFEHVNVNIENGSPTFYQSIRAECERR